VKTPVTLIAGYLGAGKTTLINACLRTRGARKVAILVNDFGDINIDASLIESKAESLWSLAGGCVCCSIGISLLETLEALSNRSELFDHVLLETSGVALPRLIAQSINLTASFVTEAVWVLADGLTIGDLSSDPYVGDTVRKQLAQADAVLVTKLGTMRGDFVQRMASMQATPVLEVSLSAYHCDWVLGPAPVLAREARTFSPRPLRMASRLQAEHLFKSLSFEMDAPVNVTELCETLRELACARPPLLVRAKGFVRDRTQPEQWLVLQMVGQQVTLTAVPDRPTLGQALVQSLALIGLRAPMSKDSRWLDQLTRHLGVLPS
jgi:G3E family GTPase